MALILVTDLMYSLAQIAYVEGTLAEDVFLNIKQHYQNRTNFDNSKDEDILFKLLGSKSLYKKYINSLEGLTAHRW